MSIINELYEACQKGNLEIVKTLINNNQFDLNK